MNKEKNKKYTCSKCGGINVELKNSEHKFPYGRKGERVELVANVPIRICHDCGLQVLDKNAYMICQEAICEHIGVMTPSQIKELRKNYNLTQTEFAQITKLGEATLSRWERGTLIQNAAYDNYLYLLKFPANYRIIQRRTNRDDNLIKYNEDNESNMIRLIPSGSPSFSEGECIAIKG